MNNQKKQSQSGFTIVEVMIATLVFSLILVGSMAALVQLGRLYQKGVISARTQETNRNVLADISQSIQFTKQPVSVPTLPTPAGVTISESQPHVGFFCIGPRRYTYALDRQLVPDSPTEAAREKQHVLWVDTPAAGGCANISGITPANLDAEDPCNGGALCSDGRELLSEGLRISRLDIRPGDAADPTSGLWTIELSLAYGDSDLLEAIDGRYQCISNAGFSTEFCALSELSTTVVRRLGN